MVYQSFIHGEHLQRVALKPIYPNHPPFTHIYYRPRNKRLPRTQVGSRPNRSPSSAHTVRFSPEPKSIFRAHSSVLARTEVHLPRTQFGSRPNRSPLSAHTVRFSPGPKSPFRAHSSVLARTEHPRLCTVTTTVLARSDICRAYRSPPASRPGSAKLPTRLSCLPCRYHTEPKYRPN